MARQLALSTRRKWRRRRWRPTRMPLPTRTKRPAGLSIAHDAKAVPGGRSERSRSKDSSACQTQPTLTNAMNTVRRCILYRTCMSAAGTPTINTVVPYQTPYQQPYPRLSRLGVSIPPLIPSRYHPHLISSVHLSHLSSITTSVVLSHNARGSYHQSKAVRRKLLLVHVLHSTHFL